MHTFPSLAWMWEAMFRGFRDRQSQLGTGKANLGQAKPTSPEILRARDPASSLMRGEG